MKQLTMTMFMAAGLKLMLSISPLLGDIAPEAPPLAGPKPSKVTRRWYADDMATQLKQVAVDPMLQEMKELRSRQTADKYTPVFHFIAPHRRMNDPNGLCFWKGHWHLFYQAYPGSGRLHWGHAYSKDLATWKDLPVAIYPDKEHHACSGSTFVEDKQVVALYNGHPVGSMVATSNDPLLLNWHKLAENPVIKQTKGREKLVKDTCIWKEEDGYYAVTPRNLYHSKNLKDWKFIDETMLDLKQVQVDGDAECSCPYFFPFGKSKYLLIYFSHERGGQYFLGNYDKVTHKFTPYHHDRFTRGPVWHGSFHAPSAFPDGKGGAYAIFNVAANRGSFLDGQVMSVPAHLSLNEAEMLVVQPVAALEQLREKKSHEKLKPQVLPAGREVVFEQVHGTALDIHMTIAPEEAKAIQIKVFRHPAMKEYMSIAFDLGVEESEDRITLDVSRISLLKGLKKQPPEIAPLRREKDKPLDLRIFVDRCIVEVFVNKQRWMLLRAYPTLDESDGVSVQTNGGDARLLRLESWKMKSCYDQ